MTAPADMLRTRSATVAARRVRWRALALHAALIGGCLLGLAGRAREYVRRQGRRGSVGRHPSGELDSDSASRPAESAGQRYRIRGAAGAGQAGGARQGREASAGRDCHQEQASRRRRRRHGQRARTDSGRFKRAGSEPAEQQVRSAGFESGVSRAPGAGRIGPGANTTLGIAAPAYAAQIQQLVASHWHTGDVDAGFTPRPR